MSADTMRSDRETSKDSRDKQVKRVPIEKQNVLTAQATPGYFGMWINELPGAIASHELAGWKLKSDPNFKSHDGQAQMASQLDSVVRRVVSKDPFAEVRTAVWMEIPLEYYKEDHLAHQKAITDQEDQWTNNAPGEYGDVRIT